THFRQPAAYPRSTSIITPEFGKRALSDGRRSMALLPQLLCLLALLALLAVVQPSLRAEDLSAEDYGYPLANPFEASIATTPLDLRADVPGDDDIDQADYSLRLRP